MAFDCFSNREHPLARIKTMIQIRRLWADRLVQVCRLLNTPVHPLLGGPRWQLYLGLRVVLPH